MKKYKSYAKYVDVTVRRGESKCELKECEER
jgi:hypothetical protein